MFRLCLFAIVATAFCFALPDTTVEKELTGQLTWVGKDPFDSTWKILVELLDKDAKHTEAHLVASTIILNQKSFPISFTLKYKPSEIKPEHSYFLFVQINGTGDRLFYNNGIDGTPVVFTQGKGQIMDITLQRIEKSTGQACPTLKCAKQCEFGFAKKDGCDICECSDPCKTKKCELKQKCVVEKKDNGKFHARCEAAPSKRTTQVKPIAKTAEKVPEKKVEVTHTKADCALPKVVGTCRRAEPRFWYNSTTKKCEQFTYGGCKGNQNNFKSIEECEKLCKV